MESKHFDSRMDSDLVHNGKDYIIIKKEKKRVKVIN